MSQYSKTYDPGVYDIIVKVTENSGAIPVEGGGTATAHTVRFYLGTDDDANLQFMMSVRFDVLGATIVEGVQRLRDQEADISEVEKLLVDELGFTEDPDIDQVDTPTGLTATQPGGAGTATVLTFDQIPGIVYEYQQSTASNFAGAFTSAAGFSSPYSVGPYAAGMRYFRIRATMTGMLPSAWASTSLNVA